MLTCCPPLTDIVALCDLRRPPPDLQIIYLCHQFGMSVGIATSIRVSTMLGAGDPAGAKRSR